MAVALELVLFVLCLAVTLTAAAFFARQLDRVGLRLGLPETLLGLLTAVAADAPELSSAIAALVKGAHSVGVGVVIGSNVFNLAAMVGLGALLAGGVRLRPESLVVEGCVGLAITLVVAALIAGLIGPVWTLALVAAVLIPYVVLLTLGPHRIEHVSLPRRPARFLHRSFGEEHRATLKAVHAERLLLAALLLLAAGALIVGGSAGMVETALRCRRAPAGGSHKPAELVHSRPLGAPAAGFGGRERDAEQQHHQPLRRGGRSGPRDQPRLRLGSGRVRPRLADRDDDDRACPPGSTLGRGAHRGRLCRRPLRRLSLRPDRLGRVVIRPLLQQAESE